MPLNESVRLLAALAGAFDYAHAQGAVHRDIKPANILFTEQGEPVLTDFGIAKLLHQTVQISMTGSILGTPAYMSPEQAAGKPVDGRSDLYSLGVVAYELVTGRVPFLADSPTALLMQHLLESPPPPRTFQPEPARRRSKLCSSRCWPKNRQRALSSAGAFAQALRTALQGQAWWRTSHPGTMTVVEQRPLTPAPAVRPLPAQPRPPSSADQPSAQAATEPVFVAREQELAQLQAFLERALAGQGQVCFVTGEAGAGKTALVTAFARRAQLAHTELVVVAGTATHRAVWATRICPFVSCSPA